MGTCPVEDFAGCRLPNGCRRLLPEKLQGVEHCGGGIGFADRRSARLLGELFSRGVGDYGKVGMHRLRQGELLLEEYLPGGRVKQICTTDNVGNALPRVIDYNGELIGEITVGTQDDKVSDIAGEILLLMPLDCVVKRNCHIVHANAPGARSAAGGQAMSAGARVDGFGAGAQRRVGNFAAGTGAGKCQVSLLQRVHRVFVKRRSPALELNAAIPLEAAGFEQGQDRSGRAFLFAGAIEVFNAYQPFTIRGASVEPTADRRDKGPEVKRAGRGGGETAPVFQGFHEGLIGEALRWLQALEAGFFAPEEGV